MANYFQVQAVLLLMLASSGVFAVRVLDEVQPPDSSPPVTTAFSGEVGIPAESPIPSIEPSTTTTTTASSVVSPIPPVTTSVPATSDHALTFFMHDILGGTNPSARVVTGVVANTAVNGQIPFSKPNGAVLPVNNGININTGNNGVINNNNVPFLTGLSGTTSAIQGNVNGGSNTLPFFTGGNLPSGAPLQKLLFGTLTVIDDDMTEGHEIGSAMVGKAQGFYVASSEDGNSQTMAFTALFKEGQYADSLSFFGVHRTSDSESHVAVVGGTGKYVNAKGFATLRTLPPVDQKSTDGMETLVEFSVYLV